MKRPGGIQSIEIATRVLDIVIASPSPMRLTDISALAEMAPSKTRPYLITLIKVGLVRQDERDRSYTIGGKLASWGAIALQRDDLFYQAQEAVVALGRVYGDPVILSHWQEDRSVIVLANHNDSLPVSFRPGGATPLDTATGRVCGAYLRFDADFIEKNIADPARRARFVADLPRVREAGYASTNRVLLRDGIELSGYSVLSAPILSDLGELRYVLTILHPTVTTPADAKERVEELLACAAGVRRDRR